MGTTEFVFDTSEATFDTDVLNLSFQSPVVVDFWAPWCGPCKMLGPILERLAIESEGNFYLAKVNVDDNPNLSVRFGVQGIPAVKAFREGEITSSFVGALPEAKIREFLRDIGPSEADHAIQEAASLLVTRHWSEAEARYSMVLEEQPNNAAATLGFVRALVAQGKGRQALTYIEDFPGGSEIIAAKQLEELARLIAEVEGKDEHEEEQDMLDAQYWQSARLLARGHYEAGMDGLLEVLRVEKDYRKGEPRKVMLGMFALLGDDDTRTREYRGELASVLY